MYFTDVCNQVTVEGDEDDEGNEQKRRKEDSQSEDGEGDDDVVRPVVVQVRETPLSYSPRRRHLENSEEIIPITCFPLKNILELSVK